MRKTWKKMMAVWCAAVMFMAMPGMCVSADEMQEEKLSAAEVEVPEVVGAGPAAVGDGVTATFDPDTGALELTSQDGVLWSNWLIKLYQADIDTDEITSIRVSSGTVYLPADSSNIFFELTKLTEMDMSGFDSSNVTDMYGMFSGCGSLTALDLSGFDTSNVTDMTGMFYECASLTDLNLSGFNTSNVTSMYAMFYQCGSLTELDLSDFETSNVTEMDGMFYECGGLTGLDLSSFNTSGLTSMRLLFYKCSSLADLDVSSFNTSNVTDMYGMFYECRSLTELDVSSFDTSNVTDMCGMFYGCSSLTKLDLSSFNTSGVTDMYGMFRICGSLTDLDLSGFDTTNVEEYARMFDQCSDIQTLKTPKKNSLSIELPITMYDESGNAYTALPETTESIVLTREDPTVTPTPTPTPSGFSDVQDPSHPYYNAIYWAADEDITKGYSDGTFGIDKSCTRGEMIMFLWRFAGKPAPKAASKSPFKDVPTSHTFYKAVLWAYQTGVTKGYSDGTFGINRNVSRGECMMFLWRIKGRPAPTAASKSPFKDVAKTHAFYNAILWGSQKGITKGYTSGPKKGNFGINDNCTRGQIVTFLYRAK